LNELTVIRELGIDWRQHLLLLARYSYLTIKIHDKLEKWEELESIDKFYLQDQFRRVAPVMPGPLFSWMIGHYKSALALAALRAGDDVTALEHIESAIDAARRQSASTRLLLADRRVVRAMILQYRQMVNADQKDRSAIDDLIYAKAALERYGGLGTKDEVHLAGRFYGAVAFLALSLSLSDEEIEKILGPDIGLRECARRAHDFGKRLPYGVMAGRYCEAYLYYCLAKEQADGSRFLRHAYELLRLGQDGEIGPSAHFKYRSLISVIGQGLGAHADDPGTAQGYARRHIDKIGFAAWLATPLN